eukprot:g7673.t1
MSSRWQRAGAKLKTAAQLGLSALVQEDAGGSSARAQARGDGGSGWLAGSSAERSGLGAELIGDVVDFAVPKDQGSLCLTLNEGACPATGVRQTVIEYMPRFGSGAVGPAEEAGLCQGDVLLAVAGRSVLGVALDDVLGVLRAAPVDRPVHFRVLRPADAGAKKKKKKKKKLFSRAKDGKPVGEMLAYDLNRVGGSLGVALADATCPATESRVTVVHGLPRPMSGGVGAAEAAGLARLDVLLTVGGVVVAGMATREAERALRSGGECDAAAGALGASHAAHVRLFRPAAKFRARVNDSAALSGQDGATDAGQKGGAHLMPAASKSGGWRVVRGISKALGIGSFGAGGETQTKKLTTSERKRAKKQREEAAKALSFDGMHEAALAHADPRAVKVQEALKRKESSVLRTLHQTVASDSIEGLGRVSESDDDSDSDSENENESG